MLARRGGQWLDHRQVINGVLWRTRTGSPWRDLPDEFGNWKTVYMRHRRWSMDGTWERVLDELRRGCDAGEGREWTLGVDPLPRGHISTQLGHPARPPSRPTQGAPPNY